MLDLFEHITSMIGKILKPIVRNPPPIPVVQAPFVKPLPIPEPTPEIKLEFTPKTEYKEWYKTLL